MVRSFSYLLKPIFWKAMVTLLGAGFALVNLTVDTSTLVSMPSDSVASQSSGIKAAAFAIITAMALFAGSLPTGDGRLDKVIDSSSRMLGILSTLGAGWFWLHGETHGNPGAYLYGILILTATAFVTVLIWGGIYALCALTLKQVGGVLRHPVVSLTRLMGALFNGNRENKEAIAGGLPGDLDQRVASPARREREESGAP